MKIVVLPLLLGALPLSAGDRNVEIGLVVGQAQARSYGVSESWGDLTNSTRYNPSNPTTIGLRFGLDVAHPGKAEFQVTATWQPKAKDDLLIASDGSFGSSSFHDEFNGKYGYEYLAVGGRFSWKVPADLGLGLDLRSEKMEFSASGLSTESASMTRPWLTFHVGGTWKGARVSPFLRMEITLALTKESDPDVSGDPSIDDFIKPTAPKSHLMLVGGLRF